jgi:hypothetical protein
MTGNIRCPFCEGNGTLTIPSAAPPAPANQAGRISSLAARVRELEEALRAERERCAQIAESQTLAEQTTWTQAGAHVARVIREGET